MTKKSLFVTLPVAALLAGGAATLSAESSEIEIAPPASEFVPIQRYAISYSEPRDVAEFYLKDFGFKTYDAKFTELDHNADQNMRVVLVTVDGIKDDAVRGVQWRFGLRPSAGSWEAVEAGIRRKCQRGDNTDQWTKDVCP